MTKRHREDVGDVLNLTRVRALGLLRYRMDMYWFL